MVGSASSELRSVPGAHAGHQVAQPVHQGVQVQLVRVVDRRGHQAAAADGGGAADVDSGGGLEASIAVEPVELREVPKRQGDRLDEEHAHQDASLRRQIGVAPGRASRWPGSGRWRGSGSSGGSRAWTGSWRRRWPRAWRPGPVRGGGPVRSGGGRDSADFPAVRTSARRTAPSGPLPVRPSNVMPSSWASRRAAGEARWRPGVGVRAPAAGSAAGVADWTGLDWRRLLCLGRHLRRLAYLRRCGRELHASDLQLRHRGTHWDRLPDLDQRPAHNAVVEDLDIDRPLLGLHHGNDVALGETLAGLLHPLDQGAGLHVCTQGGHAVEGNTHRPRVPLAAATMSGTWGRAASSRCLG